MKRFGYRKKDVKEGGAFRLALRIFRSTLFVSIFTILGFSSLLAQGKSGTIIGQLVDAVTGEPLIGANVLVEGTTMGASSDVDGVFVITNVPAGEYTLLILYIGYQEIRITGVEVTAGESSQKLELAVQPETIQGEEVVVEAKMLENTQASMLKKRQRSSAVSDAISAEEFSRSGSGDAAEAVKQVVGASVVDGKYVYVRGLGDRYSSTQLNGVELPSSDPEKKAFQLDLLPTNLLDNIVTIKTFTPDKPGNFSGGIVDVATKNFPEQLTFKASFSSSYNSQVNLEDNFLTYSGGDRDWLGSDDGTRALPDALENGTISQDDLPSSRAEVRRDPNGPEASASKTVGQSFSSIMDVKRDAAPVNQSLALSLGNQIALGRKSSLGYLGSFTYGRNYSYYDEGEIGIYILNGGAEELNPQLLLRDSQGSEEATLGGLAAFSLNINPEQQIGGNIFYSRSGISTARFQEGVWPQELDYDRIVNNRVLSYLERNVASFQLRGKHLARGLLNSTIEWNAARSFTSQDEPDRRLIFSYVDTSRTPTQYVINGSNFDDPSRYFRNLEDDGSTVNLDVTLPFNQWSGMSSQFKVGLYHQQMDRKFRERIFTYLTDNDIFNAVNGDLNSLFSEENFNYYIDSSAFGRPVRGNIITENSKPRNSYDGAQTVQALYGMFDLPLTRSLRFIGGVRYETTEIEVISQDSTIDRGSIDEQDLLPSLNLVYQLNDNMNLRLAATQTLARPNFREIAPYSSKEFVNDYDFRGNPFLKRTVIDNYDLRWEWFKRPGEILAVSGFYKRLKNPIERTFAAGTQASNRIVTLENVDEATILGAELEARFRLDMVSRALANFSLGGNLSLVKSEIDIAEAEYLNRLATDSTASKTRELQGQSPYIFNLDLTYNNLQWGTTASMTFNTFGERLSRVSRGLTPDVFEQPAPRLDFVLSQQLLWAVSFKLAVKNILDSDFKETYEFRGQDVIYTSYNRGTSYTVGLSYSL